MKKEVYADAITPWVMGKFVQLFIVMMGVELTNELNKLDTDWVGIGLFALLIAGAGLGLFLITSFLSGLYLNFSDD